MGKKAPGGGTCHLNADCCDPVRVVYGSTKYQAHGMWCRYEGAGIYRHVYLVATSQTHIAQDGVFAPAEITSDVHSVNSANGMIGPTAGLTGDAVVHASAAVVGVVSTGGVNHAAAVSVTFQLYDGTTEVAHGSSTPLAASLAPTFHNTSLSVPRARLWSIASPSLYTLVSIVKDGGGKELDIVNTTIGIRSLAYTGDGGMFINNQHVKVRGFCDHESWGGIGMAVPDRVALFRAQASRSVGGNGRRSSHNPAHPVILDIYDRVGMVVMDENRKYQNDSSDINAMAEMVQRDRNHASVTIWSFCNEGTGRTFRLAAPEFAGTRLLRVVFYTVVGGCLEAPNGTGSVFRAQAYNYDATRPVLGNHNGGDLNNYMDVQGFSHKNAVRGLPM